MSDASERANGRASGPVPTSRFLFVPDHSAMTSTTMTMMSEEEAMINDSICMNPRRNEMRKKIKSVYDIVLSVNLKMNELTPEKVTFYHVLPRSRNTKLKHRSFNVKNMSVLSNSQREKTNLEVGGTLTSDTTQHKEP